MPATVCTRAWPIPGATSKTLEYTHKLVRLIHRAHSHPDYFVTPCQDEWDRRLLAWSVSLYAMTLDAFQPISVSGMHQSSTMFESYVLRVLRHHIVLDWPASVILIAVVLLQRLVTSITWNEQARTKPWSLQHTFACCLYIAQKFQLEPKYEEGGSVHTSTMTSILEYTSAYRDSNAICLLNQQVAECCKHLNWNLYVSSAQTWKIGHELVALAYNTYRLLDPHQIYEPDWYGTFMQIRLRRALIAFYENSHRSHTSIVYVADAVDCELDREGAMDSIVDVVACNVDSLVTDTDYDMFVLDHEVVDAIDCQVCAFC